MIFSDFYKSPKSPFSKLRTHSSQNSEPERQNQHPHLSSTALAAQLEYGDAELVSQNKAKQKEAVRRYLAGRIINDWSFDWPAQTTATAAAEAARAKQLLGSSVQMKEEATNDGQAQAQTPGSNAHPSTNVEAEAEVGAEVEARVDEGADCDDDPEWESDYSTVSEDLAHFHSRAEWVSDVSDEEISPCVGYSYYASSPPPLLYSPFRFDTPDSIGPAVKANAQARRAKARRELRAEMAWNTGLACFVARRDAWTGARTVRVKPSSPTPVSPRRNLFRFHSHAKSEPVTTTPETPAPLSPTAAALAAATTTATTTVTTTPTLSPVASNSRHSENSQQSTAAGPDTVETSPMTSDAGGAGGNHMVPQPSPCTFSDTTKPMSLPSSQMRPPHKHLRRCPSHPQYAVETLLPIARPLLPPANPMRSSITPNLYSSIYDKVVLNSLQPSCPINLADAVRACVAGWKRDGEWPPPHVEVTPAAAAITAMADARKKQRREEKDKERIQKQKEQQQRENEKERQKEKEKERRSSSSLPSPRFSRRMSSLLSGARPVAASLSTNVAAGTGIGRISPTFDSNEDGTGRGIRKSLQRVLGLGIQNGHQATTSTADTTAMTLNN